MRVRLVHAMSVPQSFLFISGQPAFMRERGFEIFAISSPGEWLSQFAEADGITATTIEMARRITPVADLRAILAIARYLRSMRADVVHAHTPKAGLLTMVAAWVVRIPLRIYHMHGLPFVTAAGPRRLLLKWTERVACLLAHRVLCVSEGIRQVAVDAGVCPPKKIVVPGKGSCNGVDATGRFDPGRFGEAERRSIRAQLGIPVEAPVVGFVGRIVRDKGLVELAHAWEEIREVFPEARLLVVGPFEQQDPLPPETEAVLRSDPRIHLTGEVRDTARLYAAMDIVVLPSYREGFPTVPLEAASMVLPVVATAIPGCIDAVQDGTTGRLVPPRDSRALAQAISEYMRDPESRRRHGQAGRARMLRDFRREGIWHAVYEEYTRLMRDRGMVLPVAIQKTASEAPPGRPVEEAS